MVIHVSRAEERRAAAPLVASYSDPANNIAKFNIDAVAVLNQLLNSNLMYVHLLEINFLI